MTGWAHAMIGTRIDWHYLIIVLISDMVLLMITIICIDILIIRMIIITIYFNFNDQGQVDNRSEQLQHLQQASDLRGGKKRVNFCSGPTGGT